MPVWLSKEKKKTPCTQFKNWPIIWWRNWLCHFTWMTPALNPSTAGSCWRATAVPWKVLPAALSAAHRAHPRHLEAVLPPRDICGLCVQKITTLTLWARADRNNRAPCGAPLQQVRGLPTTAFHSHHLPIIRREALLLKQSTQLYVSISKFLLPSQAWGRGTLKYLRNSLILILLLCISLYLLQKS